MVPFLTFETLNHSAPHSIIFVPGVCANAIAKRPQSEVPFCLCTSYKNEAEGHFSMIANCLFRLVELLLEEQSNSSTTPGGYNLFDAHTQ